MQNSFVGLVVWLGSGNQGSKGFGFDGDLLGMMAMEWKGRNKRGAEGRLALMPIEAAPDPRAVMERV